MQQQYPSQLLERAVSEFSRLPGIGRKTALRLVLHLLREDADDVHQFTQSVDMLCREVKHCKVCHNISDTEVCSICGDASQKINIIKLARTKGNVPMQIALRILELKLRFFHHF